MIIHRSNTESGFTKLPNETARDVRLSYRARGILAELLSHRDGWTVTADDMWRQAQQAGRPGDVGDGRDAIRAARAELAAAGYLYLERRRGRGGRFVTETHVSDLAVDNWPALLEAGRLLAEAVDNPALEDVSAGHTRDGLPGQGTTWANMHHRRSHQRRSTRRRSTRRRSTRRPFTRRPFTRRSLEDQGRRPSAKTTDRIPEPENQGAPKTIDSASDLTGTGGKARTARQVKSDSARGKGTS